MEKETYTAYDLEKDEPRIAGASEIPLEKSVEEKKEEIEDDAARHEIDEMVSQLGAKKVLELIRDNRNAAIEVVMKEMEDDSSRPLPSGASIGSNYNSIFELASLA